MRASKWVLVLAAVVVLFAGLPVAAQQSGGDGYDLEIYEVNSGNNATTAQNGDSVTFRLRYVVSSESTGTCGATAVTPNECASYNLTVNWDPTVLSYVSHSDTSPFPFSTVVDGNTGTGVISVTAFGTGASAATEDILDITFNVVGTAGDSTALSITNLSGSAYFGDTGGNDLCGTFTDAPAAGSTGSDDYYDVRYNGALDVVSGPGITVTPTSGLTTTEAGGTDTFDVVLQTAPTADVTIGISSDDTSEGTPDVASLTFTTGNWSTAQTVTVTGVDDDIDDGDVAYNIVTAAATGAAEYVGLDPDDVAVTNTDDDTAGITVNPTSGLITTEAGGTDTFDVVLDSEPTADVSIAVSSDDVTEGTVSTASLTFTAANWDTPQTVTVTGVDDAVSDGDVAYNVVLDPATSADGSYSGIDPTDVAVTNQDDDSPGVNVNPTSVNATEGGATGSYDVVLNTQPSADVDITITPADTTNGSTVSPGALTFTSANWDTPQSVTVTAVDDAVLEGAHTDTISHTSASGDGDYDAATIADVTVNITDNEVAVWLSDDGETPAAGTAADDVVVAEEGATSDTIRVALAAGPSGDVNFTVSSDAQTTVTPENFTLSDNGVVQDITVTAVDDPVYEGGPGTFHPSTISITATSVDPTFDGFAEDVIADVEDNDERPAIPVLGTAGMAVLLTLLAAIGVIVIRMRR